MNVSTRACLSVLTLACAAFIAPVAVAAYPDKPIKMIVPFGAGTATDILARTVGEQLSQALGQPIIIDNKAGAGSTVGMNQLKRSPGDGYTFILSSNAGLVASPAGLVPDAGYDPIKDFTPVASIATISYIWVTHPGIDAKGVPALVDYIKQNPGKLNYASANAGSVMYMALLKEKYGLDIAHIPYKSTPTALTDLMGQRVQMMFADITSSTPLIKDGKLKAYVVTTAQRSPLLPEVPTFAEQGITDIPDMSGWWGIYGPADLPADIAEKLNTETNKVLNTPAVQEKLLQMGIVTRPTSRKELAEFHASQFDTWKTLIKKFGIEP